MFRSSSSSHCLRYIWFLVTALGDESHVPQNHGQGRHGKIIDLSERLWHHRGGSRTRHDSLTSQLSLIYRRCSILYRNWSHWKHLSTAVADKKEVMESYIGTHTSLDSDISTLFNNLRENPMKSSVKFSDGKISIYETVSPTLHLQM